MTIELVSKTDCVGNGDRNGKGKIGYGSKSYKGKMKRIDNRDRKKCHKCGYDNGIWYEYLDHGRQVYHFLCQSCIDTIESGKG